ncbi:casein kinase 2 beta polypeptide [Gracilaria domingensis]|nr:casein kinase 2 beta polypeptide [Gracilaria domingensis]
MIVSVLVAAIAAHLDGGPVDLEAIYSGHVVLEIALGYQRAVRVQKHVRKGGAPKGAVQVVVNARSGKVQVPAAGTEGLDSGVARHVAQADRQHLLPVTKDARTAAKGAVDELGAHGVHAVGGEDVARVDEAVERLGGDLDELLLALVELAVGDVDVEDGVERVVVVGDLRGQAGEVEVVVDKVLLDLAEELVALELREPGNPGGVLGGAGVDGVAGGEAVGVGGGLGHGGGGGGGGRRGGGRAGGEWRAEWGAGGAAQ